MMFGSEHVECTLVECDEIESEAILEDDDSSNDDVLRSFIETYESLPQLWNSSHPSYMNKTKRNLALDRLRVIYQKMKPGATRTDVRRKINTLRSNYRKELKKIANANVSGRGTDEAYQPTSWVFHALKFLHMNVQLKETPCYGDTSNSDASQMHAVVEKRLGEPSRSSIIPPPHPEKKQREVGPVALQNELLSLACKYLIRSNDPEDDVPTIAKVWGEKLKALDQRQRIFAEKAINDVLFEASLGNLNRYSVKINEDPYQRNPSV